MFVPMGTLTVTGVRRTDGPTDKLGNPTRVETAFDIPGCMFQPYSPPLEQLGNVDLSISVWKLFTPPGHGLAVTDAVRINGLTYEILGDPQMWPDPITGADHHAEIWLRRATG